MAGLTPNGFEKLTLPEIKSEIEDVLKGKLGTFINLLPGSVFSQLVGTFAERESLLWDQGEAIYNSQYPDTAEGINLDNVVSITGIERLKATESRIAEQILFGTIGVFVPAGTIFDVPGNPSARFLTDAGVFLDVGVNEVQHIGFASVPLSGTWKITFDGQQTGTLAFNASAATIQTALNALSNGAGITVAGDYTLGFTVTFAGAAGKQDQPLLSVSVNTMGVVVTPSVVTEGVPQASVSMTCASTGLIPAARGTLTNIVTPVSGLSGGKNTAEALVGRAVETDAELRLRRISQLQVAGAGTIEAIRAKLLQVLNVTQAIVFENQDNVVDDNGLAPHSIKAFVQGGTNFDIAKQLFLTKAGGIKTNGDISVNITDSMGIDHDVRFSRPTLVPIYITIRVTKAFGAPSNLADLVRNALADYINSLQIGEDVIVFPKVICTLDQFDGIVDIEIGIDTDPSPALGFNNNIIIAVNELAKVVNPNSDIVVTVV